MSSSFEVNPVKSAGAVQQEGFRDYMVAEIACMCDEIGEEIPGSSDDLNKTLMEWIEKNAQNFRDTWARNRAADTMVNV